MIIVVDTETTHYKPQLAHVIEIGAYGVDSTGTPRKFESLCNPGEIPANLLEAYYSALEINGISHEEVQRARPIGEVVEDFRHWLNRFGMNVTLAGYNSNNYDAPILARTPWMVPKDLWRFDVMQMAIGPMDKAGVLPHHPYYGTPKWPKLSEVERFFGIQREGTAHRALSDAKATFEILQLLTGQVEIECGRTDEDPHYCPYSVHSEETGRYLCCYRSSCKWKRAFPLNAKHLEE